MFKNILAFYYFIVIFSNVYLWSIKFIGGLSIRVPLFLMNFVLIFFLYKRKTKNIYLLVFPLFFLFFSLISVANDDFGNVMSFLKDIVFSRFAISYMLIVLTLVLFPNYIDFKKAINILILIASFNSIVIFGQFLNISFIWTLTDIITADRYSDFDLKFLVELKGSYRGLVGTVKSGYLLCLLAPLILYKILTSEKKMFWRFFLLFNILISILLQQRLAFVLIVLNALYYFYFFNFKKKKAVYVIIFGLGLCFFLLSDYNVLFLDSSNSRLISLEDKSREQLYLTALNFISNRPFLGGFDSFYFLLELSPHNLFLNAWIRGGFFGFIPILIMVIIIVKKSYKIIRKGRLANPISVFFALAFLNYIVLSLTHNEGLTSADGITFILLAFFMLTIGLVSNNKSDLNF
jgi:hypothetical protein